MDNNFDLKKYDKKVALNYNFLASKKTSGFLGSVRALYGETCHFSAGQKFPENEEELFNAVCSGLNDDGVRGLSAAELAEALCGVTEYAVASGNEKALSCAKKIWLLLRSETDDEARESDAGEKCLLAEASALYFCATNDEKARTECLNILNGFGAFTEALADKVSPEELARLVKSALDMSVATGEQKYKTFAADALGYCLTKGLSLNYAAKNSFKNATFASAAATSVLFSLCVKFYKITGDGKYSYFARRIWYNGLQFCQRAEGGAGEDSVTSGENRYLQVTRYLNDRDGCYLAEALAVYSKNKQIFADAGANISRDKSGRVLMGDKIFASDESGFFGKDLIEIPTMTAFDKDVALQLRLKI